MCINPFAVAGSHKPLFEVKEGIPLNVQFHEVYKQAINNEVYISNTIHIIIQKIYEACKRRVWCITVEIAEYNGIKLSTIEVNAIIKYFTDNGLIVSKVNKKNLFTIHGWDTIIDKKG